MHKLEEYIAVGSKRMRCGYTTGTCAAASARAAAELLLGGALEPAVTVSTLAGTDVVVDIETHERGENWAACSCLKDAGDDTDATDGVQVFARVSLCEGPGVLIDGGEGVGRVTRAGLDQPVGAAAINSVPRQMIERELVECARQAGYGGGLSVVVSIPAGVEIAARTFNPRLGIEGGISILGTSGIVRPMSEDALIASIELEMHMRREEGVSTLLVMPGNYGYTFARDELGLDVERGVQCSNYLGAMLDCAVREGFEELLIVGHIGKMAKLACGAMNTHSKVADGRAEAFAAHAALAGAPQTVVAGIMEAVTTDDMVSICSEAGVLEPVMASMATRMKVHVDARVRGALHGELVVFSKVHGLLARTSGAQELLEALR